MRKKLISEGKILVNAEQAKSLSQNVLPQLDVVSICGKIIPSAIGEVYFILNKPKGVVTAVTDEHYPTVIELLKTEDRHKGIYPIGRLDYNTTGLVLITNNGPLGYQMLHPNHHVTKVYRATVNGLLTQEMVKSFAEGVTIDEATICKPAKLTILESGLERSVAEVEISEGKNHQVKKMFLSIGVKVIELDRIAFGSFTLPTELQRGEYRPLTSEELSKLKHYQ